MPLSVNTLEATDIQSNQMTLNGELIDIGNYDVALCYFEYGQKADLSDSVKSTECTLLDQPGKYSLIQKNVNDNSIYYFKAAAQNYEITETQTEYLNNTIINNPDLISYLVSKSSLFAVMLANQNLMYNIFSSDNLELIWSGDITSIGSDYIYVYAQAYPGSDTKTISLKNKVDLTNYSNLKIDWYNIVNFSDSKCDLLINDSAVISGRSGFSRQIDTIDVSAINTPSTISVRARDTYRGYGGRYYSKVYVYSIWCE
ncbi:MAG: hypothetical protein FH762_18595 [Firmicutes bacterium]|nr:hypothetical protein [Bacillota bacterium]